MRCKRTSSTMAPRQSSRRRTSCKHHSVPEQLVRVLNCHLNAQTYAFIDGVDGKKPLVAVSVTRPLMDKTPFPNRVAGGSKPGNAGKTPGLKLSKLALLAPEPGQESTSPDAAPLLRPSSLRKSLRGRLSQNFKTPLTKGNYWDVSPGDAEGIGGGLAEQTQQQTESVPTEEDDEIEYMPPKTIGEPL